MNVFFIFATVIAEAEKLALETKAADDRIQGLLKWKEERKRKLDAEKNQKKPAFKVGVVTHNIGSPYFKVYDDSKKTHNPVRKHQFQVFHLMIIPCVTKLKLIQDYFFRLKLESFENVSLNDSLHSF